MFIKILTITTLVLMLSGISHTVVAQNCSADITPVAPDERYQDNGDGTVTDLRTNLMWHQCSSGLTGADCLTGTVLTYSWDTALQNPVTVNATGFAGHHDWRLPNTKELESLIELACYDPAINLTLFPNTVSDNYWTSSPAVYNAGQAWGISFNRGEISGFSRTTATFNVRLVRTISAVLAIQRSLNDTGITFGGSYPSGNDTVCNGTTVSQQDCKHGRDFTDNDDTDGHAGFSFTKLDANGNELPASATSWSCVRDNVTKLIWEVKTTDSGLHDAGWTYTWYNSTGINDAGDPGTPSGGACGGTVAAGCDTEKFVTEVNAVGLCGANDWRLPNRAELSSITNNGTFDPAIDSNYFPNNGSETYFSSTPYVVADSVWVSSFYNGNTALSYRNIGQRIRLVRTLP